MAEKEKKTKKNPKESSIYLLMTKKKCFAK